MNKPRTKADQVQIRRDAEKARAVNTANAMRVLKSFHEYHDKHPEDYPEPVKVRVSRMTVGDLFNKTPKEILNMNQGDT